MLIDMPLPRSCQVKAARSRGKVYSMAFVGINGVGKSTSLAKVAYYLKENGIKVWRVGYKVDTFPALVARIK